MWRFIIKQTSWGGFPKKIGTPFPPSERTVWVIASIGFTRTWAASFGRNAIVYYKSVIKQGRHWVARMLPFTRADAKKPLNDTAMSCGLFKWMSLLMIYGTWAAGDLEWVALCLSSFACAASGFGWSRVSSSWLLFVWCSMVSGVPFRKFIHRSKKPLVSRILAKV